ncbi:hypothetical protein [Undibacterium baiyunense]|uniref:Uncharacterized protein n=1 Tax=Undibacterium baiyunense TaxID=2828731 RepID=A0A941DD69_9BURK|nr:hypothetical protein [Undibacterium baiyunense]MBR7745861.1 hypothetical protein [Undibacterium baiyunense]
MTETVATSTTENNERLLAKIEDLGGGYCWDAENFAVTLMNVTVEDADAAILCELVGVQQIALDASLLSFLALERIAQIPGLQSLILNVSKVSASELDVLKRFVPEVLAVDE